MSRLGIFRCFFYRQTFLVATKRKMFNVLMITFLIIMEIAVCTLGSITLQDMKIKKIPIVVCPTFDKHFGFIFLATS